jgi:hypothetical protein
MPFFESGNFKLEYAGNFPDQLKLIKTFAVFPLEITAIGSLNPRSHKWSYSVGCRVSSTIAGSSTTCNTRTLLTHACMPGQVCQAGSHCRCQLLQLYYIVPSWNVCTQLCAVGCCTCFEDMSSASLQDVILNGKITYNAARSAVEYRCAVQIPQR